ncbi:hypothetical protein ACHAXR_007838 [Thalassiosira sp. AJA248-18]
MNGIVYFLLAIAQSLSGTTALQWSQSSPSPTKVVHHGRPLLLMPDRCTPQTTSTQPTQPSLPSSSRLLSIGRSTRVIIPSRSALHATTTPAIGNAEALFPSDDSDYEQNERDNGISSSSAAKTTTHSSSSSSSDGNSSVLQSSEIFHPTQSRIKLGGVVIVDPIDVIADWVSDRFAEQSLQSRSTSNNNENNNNNVMMESYSPGSALDAIAQASSTYTPLSYQIRTVVRVTLPSILVAIAASAVYPSLVQLLVHIPGDGGAGAGAGLADVTTTTTTTTLSIMDGGANNNLLYTDQVLTVLSNDLSQYVQNILTTCALLFGMLVGQTYYFMYQQQELVFYALFAEVTEAKSLLEQISLMTYGRPGLYPSLISRMNDYVQNDLKVLSVKDPIAVTSGLPRDDPLESILYATSVGLPGVMYETVKSLRQARANRCGALQRKLPALHIYCLRLLGVIVMAAFPVCGSGSQAIAPNVLVLQSYMFGILAFALTLVLNVVEELRNSRKMGAYNVDGILEVMVSGLEQELEERLEGEIWGVGVSPGLPVRGGVDGGGGGGGGGVENDHVWRVDNEKCVGIRREIDSSGMIGDENMYDDDTLENGGDDSFAKLPTSRKTRVKNWLQRKMLGRGREQS